MAEIVAIEIEARLAKRQRRFEAKFIPEPNSGCWLWIGAPRNKNYGKFEYQASHRKSWEFYRGPIPPGLHVLHKCDVTWCVNPDHLYLGRDKENVRDREMRKRGNHATGDRHMSRTRPETLRRGDNHPRRLNPEIGARGEAVGASHLVTADVLAIRADRRPHTHVARDFGVSPETIGHIRRRRTWKHLP